MHLDVSGVFGVGFCISGSISPRLQVVCGNPNVAAALPAAAGPNAAVLIEGAEVLETGTTPTTTQTVPTTTTAATTASTTTSTSTSTTTGTFPTTGWQLSAAGLKLRYRRGSQVLDPQSITIPEVDQLVICYYIFLNISPLRSASGFDPCSFCCICPKRWLQFVACPLLGGGTCDDVCGVGLCDKNTMARVNDDATVASVLTSLGRPCSIFQGRSSAGVPFWKAPELCIFYDGASPAGIDCSASTNPGHEALCYCKTSLIQSEEDESQDPAFSVGFRLVQVRPAPWF